MRFEQITPDMAHSDASAQQPDSGVMPSGEMTKLYAQLLEQNICAHPEQWLWTHNRWKWGRKELEG